MRVVIVGGNPGTSYIAKSLIKAGYNLIIIEEDQELIDELSSVLDCSFLQGDGTKPEVLKETDPENIDVLLCATEGDQNNILTALVGRSLGFKRVLVSIKSVEYEKICLELGLENTIIPVRMISRYLVDMIKGEDIFEIKSMFKDKVRLFSFIINKEHEGKVEELSLPSSSKIVWFFRGDKFYYPENDQQLKKGDEVVIATDGEHLSQLKEKYNGHENKN